MPFCPHGQRLGGCRRIAPGVCESGYRRPGVAAGCLRGGKGIVPVPGSRRLQSTGLHDGEIRASSGLRNVPGQVPVSVLRSRARCASVAWRWQPVCAGRSMRVDSTTSILSAPFPRGPLDQQPLLRMRLLAPVVAMGHANTQGNKPGTHHAVCSLTPAHPGPTHLKRYMQSADRVGGRVAPAVLPHHRTCGSASGGS